MEDKRTTESVVQEIMGSVHNAMSSYSLYKQADSEGWNNDGIEGRVVNDLALIKAKLRELVERCSMREPLSDEAKKKLLCEWSYSQFTGKGDFLDGVEAAGSAHNITNTNKE